MSEASFVPPLLLFIMGACPEPLPGNTSSFTAIKW